MMMTQGATRSSSVVKLQVTPGSVGSTPEVRTTRLSRSRTMQSQYTPAFLERFWSKVDRNGPIPDYAPHLGPCWLWTAGLNEKGYGFFIMKVGAHWRNRRAHRIAWQLTNGEIPEGLVCDHLCRVPRCVRPDHLELVTHVVNVLRGVGVTAVNANKAVCIRGHSNWIVPNHRRNSRDCRTCRNQNRSSENRRKRRGE